MIINHRTVCACPSCDPYPEEDTMPRETAAQRKSRISMLLADYDAKSRELRKLTKQVDELKTEIRDAVPVGTYGEWIRSEGTPREILNQPAARKALTDAGLEVPTLMTAPPVIVTPAAATK
jgi:hypothetical protein